MSDRCYMDHIYMITMLFEVSANCNWFKAYFYIIILDNNYVAK